MNPRKVVAVAPVGPPDSVHEVEQIADEVICPHQPMNFNAVGLWYESFPQTSDKEVIEIMKQAQIAKEA